MSIKEQLKPLEWREETLFTVASTPMYEYRIDENNGKYEVGYTDLNIDTPCVAYEPATGFNTEQEAKEWAFNHHCEKMAKWIKPDPLTQTLNWFKTAKPEPTYKDTTTQLGCVLEEVAELALSLEFNDLAIELTDESNFLKSLDNKASKVWLESLNDIDVLDATTDIKVTLVGFEYMQGYNSNGALNEVNASNYSKFVDGKAVTDDNGKIIKGEDYFKPDLSKFVGVSDD